MNLPSNICVFYEDKQYCQVLQDVLSDSNYNIVTTDESDAVSRFLREEKFFLVIMSVNKATEEHFNLLKLIKQNYPFTEVIFIVKWPNVNSAYNASRSGAKEFLTRTPNITEYIHTVDSIYKNVQKKYKKSDIQWTTSSSGSEVLPQIISNHPKITAIMEMIDKIACSNASVLLTGETGVGKELITQTIHKKSLCKNNPFIVFNCGAIPETLMENELFGHEKGAFTGAMDFRPGLLAEADTGTIFLDEIGELPLSLQVKLLRVIETGEFRRLGGSKEIRVNIRVISATNKDLYAEVQKNRFRADLYYRLAVIPIQIPPLRERKEDIPLIANHFLGIANKCNVAKLKTISESALKVLMDYDWPGNIRELKNCIERLAILCQNEIIKHADIIQAIPNIITSGNFVKALSRENYLGTDSTPSLKDVEKKYIEHIFEITERHIDKTAEILNISSRSLNEKIAEYGIDRAGKEMEQVKR